MLEVGGIRLKTAYHFYRASFRHPDLFFLELLEVEVLFLWNFWTPCSKMPQMHLVIANDRQDVQMMLWGRLWRPIFFLYEAVFEQKPVCKSCLGHQPFKVLA